MSPKDSNEFTDEDVEKFDWITLRRDMDNIQTVETQYQKLKRKIKENPFVPIGCLVTTAALGYGLWSFRTGQKKMSQYMMRTRIAAQGFTVIAMIVGVTISAQRSMKAKKD